MSIKQFLGLTKAEFFTVSLILLVVFSVSAFNFRIAIRKTRDSQRKSDVRAITEALNKYKDELGFYPESAEGKIKACDGGKTDLGITVFKACEWGRDSLSDLADPSYLPYLKVIPSDVHSDRGVSYYYLSNVERFQIYASLEGADEAEYDPKIVSRKLPCGIKICNFGLSSGATPLERSIEEYENEISE